MSNVGYRADKGWETEGIDLESGYLLDDVKLAQRIAAQASQFVIFDGVLYFLDPKRGNKRQAVVPIQQREELMKKVHSGLMAGHFSSNRLYNALTRAWW